MCGSSQHLAPSCTRPRSASPAKAKQLKPEVEDKGQEKKEAEAAKTKETQMKDLLEEAGKMLKTMSDSSSSTTTTAPPSDQEKNEDLMEKLQQQLNSLRQRQKTFRLQRMKSGEQGGLIDSGASHPLRPARPGEDSTGYPVVGVSLANGAKTTLKMSPGGSMLSPDEMIEPIVPLGDLVEKLGCVFLWKEGELVIQHPKRGKLEVERKDGCPQVNRRVALELISEIEDSNQGLRKMDVDMKDEWDWLQKLVEIHPVFSKLPTPLKKRLAVRPGEWNRLPCNKRHRRTMRRDGFMLHLYAGEEEGFPLSKAWKECGGEEKSLLELDIKRDSSHDMLPDDGVYASLTRAALEGKVLAVLGGPNCRTRSVLRHIPKEGAPRPVRAWGGEEYGLKDLTEEERSQVEEDDLLLWRQLFLFAVSTYARRARGIDTPPRLLLEQPASPKAYKPEVVSFWDQPEWKEFQKEFNLEETTFTQKELGGEATKPTTVGSNLDLSPEDYQQPRVASLPKPRTSKDLARWPPGMMRMIAHALQRQVWKKQVRLAPLTWEEHVQFGHIPYRRDCKVCQEAMQSQMPHRKVKHVQGGTLSLDVAGSFKPAYDMGGHQARWFLAGAFVWRVPKETEKMKAPEDEELEGNEPAIEEAGEEEEEAREEEVQGEEGQDEVQQDLPVFGPEPLGEPGDVEEATEVRVFRLAIPMITKKAKEVSEKAMQMIIKLRSEGFVVSKIHSDRGHEFSGSFKQWATSRGLILSRTSGDDARANGRAEVAIKALKTQVRRVLRQANVDHKWWPWALRYVSEVNRCIRLDRTPDFPPFLSPVRVRKRTWKRGVFSPTVEEVQYLIPSEEDHGHWICKPEEAPRVTKMLLQRTTEPLDPNIWVALETQITEGLLVRRRLRGKVAIRRMEGGESEEDEDQKERREQKERIRRLIEEEMKAMIEDEEEVVKEEATILAALKKMIEEPEESEEILQTKIISPNEVWRNWPEWESAAKAEIAALLEDKQAFEEVGEEEAKRIKREAEEKGIKFECIPSKVVYTKKPVPGGYKCKVRWVICGNYEQKTPEEENYSGGADATAFRLVIWMAARKGWVAVVLDVRTAFLNADLVQEGQVNYILVIPPPTFVKKGCLPKNVLYKPTKAVYGLRRSPRLWGLHRDKKMREFEIEVQEGKKVKVYCLKAMDSEPNLWRVLEKREMEEEEEGGIVAQTRGLVMTYVDDIFITSTPSISKAITDKLQATWTTSQPEIADPEDGECSPIRFLGMEVRCTKEDGKNTWFITQENYLKNMLSKIDCTKKKVPITKDQSVMLPDDGPPKLEDVRFCQKVVGELLWALSRTRPDLMYCLSRMGSSVTRSTRAVMEAALQAQGYLQRSAEEGLKYQDNQEDPVTIRVFTDASYAPGSEESQGCFLVFINDCPVFWRAGRQQLITLSTAEAELAELVEGLSAGESVGVMVDEMVGRSNRMAFTDSQSAMVILATDGGSWRTRHLRTRAAFARQAVQRGDWGIVHVPGEKQIADIGTKALTNLRLQFLKDLINMKSPPTSEEKNEGKKEEKEEKEEEANAPGEGGLDASQHPVRLPVRAASTTDATKTLQLITMAALILAAKGQEDEEEEGIEIEEINLDRIVIAFTVLIIVMTLWFERLWKVAVSYLGPRNSSPSENRSLPEDPKPAEDPEFEEVVEESSVQPQQPVSVTQPLQEQSSSSSEGQTSSQESMTQKIANVLDQIEEEENQMVQDLRREPPIPGDEEERDPGFAVLMTRYGSVYHVTHQCPYLTAPRTGLAKTIPWCLRCQRLSILRGRPPFGFNLWIENWDSPFHTSSKCPFKGDADPKSICIRCAETR